MRTFANGRSNSPRCIHGCRVTGTLTVAVVALGWAIVASAGGLRLDGTFIQYQEPMMAMDADAWRRELDTMRQARLSLVVVQCLQHDDRRFIPEAPDHFDPTRAILEYADRHEMQVFLGLATDKAWWHQSTESSYLDTAARQDRALADEVWKRYGRHASFAGWYLPREMWDGPYTPEQIERLAGYFRTVGDHCRTLSGRKPVAIAPFFSGNVSAAEVGRIYSRFLDKAGLDVVMLQDGVGARGWDHQVAERIVPCFAALRDACVTHGVELWSDLESFRLVEPATAERPHPRFAPAAADRIGRQLAAAAPFVQRFVTFDFFHYMSPHRHDEARTRLHEQYMATYVHQDFLPTVGRSVMIDPGFGYYRDRSPASIAAEIRANGYNIAHYILTADSLVQPELIAALHREGIGVWYVTFGNGTYSTRDLPPERTDWRMVTRTELAGGKLDDGFTRFCLNHPDYRAWKKAAMARVLNTHPFQGIDVAEPHWPEYPGIESPAYACFCPQCLAAFQRMYPEEKALPDILDTESPRHPSKNRPLWQKWLAFRQASLTDFLNDLVNGPGGLRQRAPHALVCTWTLALGGADGVRRVLEDSGEDAGEVVRVVRPDVHCLQTHWPDWLQADLPPDYVRRYAPFIAQIREKAPSLPIVIQADIGSRPENRRSWEWIHRFEQVCGELGAVGSMPYEYFLGMYTYTDPPRVTEVRRIGSRVQLHFTGRLDPEAAAEPTRYRLSPGRIEAVCVDGSIVELNLQDLRPGQACTLELRNLPSAAGRRLFDDHPPAVLDLQTLRFRY